MFEKSRVVTDYIKQLTTRRNTKICDYSVSRAIKISSRESRHCFTSNKVDLNVGTLTNLMYAVGFR